MLIQRSKWFILSVILFLTGCRSDPPNGFKGEMVLPNVLKSSYGLLLINMDEKADYWILRKHQVDEARWNADKTRILLNIPNDADKREKYVIYEYDRNTKELMPILRYRERKYDNGNDQVEVYRCVRYVPGRHAISYHWDDSLYIYDLDKKTEEKLVMMSSIYSWNREGNKILLNPLIFNPNIKIKHMQYQRDGYIYEYDLQTKSLTKLFEGINPVYSHNNDYVAFGATRNDDYHHLIVRELKTGKEWDYKSKDVIEFYSFSPDDRYIVLSELDHKIFAYPTWRMYSWWEFKTIWKGRFTESFGGGEAPIDWE
jgi:WD40 repeat protein